MSRTDPPPRRSRLTSTLLIALLTIVVLEGGARLLAPRLPAPGRWPTSDYTRHEDGLASIGPRVDTLVVGSSITGVAVRPGELPQRGVGYNHWLAGPGMESVADLTRLVLLDRAQPRRVIVGVTLREFNDGPAQRAHHDAMVNSHGFRDAAGTATWIDHADEVLRSASALAANRELLRDPARLLDQIRTGRLAPERIEADGHLAELGDQTLADEPPEHVQQEREALADYSFSERGLRALDRLLVECERRGIEVVVVNLPVTERFIGFAPGGRSDQREFEARVRAVTERRGSTWLNAFDEPWADEWFADVSHLNDRGVARLQPRLERALSTNSR